MNAVVAATLVAALLATPGDLPPPWVARVFENVQAGRTATGSETYDRSAALDAAATEYARDVAARPHAERLRQRTSIARFLEARGIDRFHHARLHLDMGKGYSDWGDKFTRSWRSYELAWKSVMDSRYDALGLGMAQGEDGWVVFVGIIVDDVKVPSDLREVERQAIEAVNEVRVEHGLGALEYHERLTLLARDYSEQMIRDGFFAHRTPDGTTLDQRFKIRGIRYKSVAENLHKSKGYDDPVPVAVDGWMDSRGHRKNILDPRFTHTGVGVAVAEDGYVYFTQLFLLPLQPK